jgi:dolichol kinase
MTDTIMLPDKTGGKHIGRKLFHLFGGLGLLSIYFYFERGTAFRIYGAIICLVLAVEIGRINIPAFNELIYRNFRSFIRRNEEQRLSGIIPYVLGVGLSLYVFLLPVAVAAVCFLAFGDVAASTAGERFGKTKIGTKSLEGTIAFAVAASAAGGIVAYLFIGLPLWIVFFGAMIAAGVELMPLGVNDNFAIPLLAGAAMEFLLRWTG